MAKKKKEERKFHAWYTGLLAGLLAGLVLGFAVAATTHECPQIRTTYAPGIGGVTVGACGGADGDA